MTEQPQDKTGEFNEAFHKINRINELQAKLNFYRAYLWQKLDRPDLKYGYELMYYNLYSLFMETATELNPKELIESQATLDQIENALSKIRMWRGKYDTKLHIEFEGTSQKEVERLFFKLEIDLRIKLSKHGIGIPGKADLTKSVVKM